MRWTLASRLGLLMWLVPLALHGQNPTSSPTCSFNKATPQCRQFWLAEVGIFTSLATTSIQFGRSEIVDVEGQLTWELSAMRSVSKHGALGLTGQAGFHIQPRFALKPRYRRWLGQRTALDLSAGYLTAGIDGPGISVSGKPTNVWSRAAGFTTDVRIDYRERIGATLRYDWLDNDKRDPAKALSLGLHTGNKFILGIYSAIGLVAMIAIAAM